MTLDCSAESPNVNDSKLRRSEAAGDAASDGCGSSLALGAVVGGASEVPVGAGMVADACGAGIVADACGAGVVADACGCCAPHAVISKTLTAAVRREVRFMAAS